MKKLFLLSLCLSLYFGAHAVAPTVTSISPSSGPLAGGISVTITGTNFTGATGVTIGGSAATNVTVVSSTTIIATTPAGTAGAKDVVVTTPGSSGTGIGLFTISGTSMSPTIWIDGPGDQMWSTTANWNTAVVPTTTSDVQIGSQPTGNQIGLDTGGAVVVGSFAFNNTLTRSVDITLINKETLKVNGSILNNSGFEDSFSLPVYAGASATWKGPLTFNAAVNIGTNSITLVNTVTFSGSSTLSFDINSSTSYGRFLGSGTTVVTGVTINIGGSYKGTAGDSFVLTSGNFTGATLGLLPTLTSGLKWDTSNFLSNGTLVVMNDLPATPSITGMSPTSGPTTGGTSVTITGTNLTGATSVIFGDIPATITANTATSITVTSPAGSAGKVSIATTVNGTTMVGSITMFTYIAPTTITVNSSTAGGLYSALSAAGGDPNTVTNLTITGTIDATDFKAMRDNMLLLAVVDMSGATIAAYTGTGGTAGATSITYPAKEVPQYAFFNSSTNSGKLSLTSLLMPSSVTSIGAASFYNCTSLTSFTIQASVNSIGDGAFCGCTGLTILTISGSVTYIGSQSFTFSNISITVDGNNPNYSSVDGVLFNRLQTTLVYCPGTKTGSYTIPSSVTSIGVGAFRQCMSLTTITIPSSVTSIGNGNFMSCSSLTTITIPASVNSIEQNAFNNCTGLTTVTIPSSVSSIGSYAFYKCTKLATINIYASTPVSLAASTTVFYNVPTSTCVLHVPVGSKGFYQGAGQWQNFTNITEDLYIPPTVTAISPSSGPLAGGTSVTITGANFTGATGVTIGGSTATSRNVLNSTTITAITPAGTAGAKSVLVTTPGGTNAANTLFTYVAAPTVTSISPISGPTAGGTSVTITGTNFTGQASVTIGGSAATNVSVVNSTTITATTPAGIAGVKSVIVTTPGGSNAANTLFTYIAAPTVASILPTSGPTAGGTLITINGTNFIGASAVKFGSTNATSYTLISATQITATSPAGTAGPVDVTVTTPGGTSVTSSSTKFTYNLTNISVSSTAGGLSTAITNAGGDLSTVTNLTITGTIDATDFKAMRDNMKLLAVLDMSGATIAAYTGIGGTGGTSSITYPANEIPQCSFCNSLTYVGKTSLTSVLMPTTVTSIGTSAFYGCRSLTTTTIPSSVTSIGEYAFWGCSGLKTTNIPSLVTSIGNSTFYGCSGLTAITIPSTVTYIGSYAFSSCTGLTTITIPSLVTTIGSSTFNGCSGLTAITIPSTVTYIGFFAFTDSKISVTVDANNPNYSSIDGVLFNKDKTTIIYTPNTKTGSYTIPASVTSIGSTAFYSCTGLTSITIPASITSIGDEGFSNCTGLTSLTIPSSVTSIGSNAFNGCTKLATLNSYSITPVSLTASTTVFASVPITSCVLHVPVGSKALYLGAEQWNAFTNITEDLVVPPTVTGISPASGTTSGSTSVVITGTSFFNVSSVKFGTTNATSFTVNSVTQITATSPAGSGIVDVTVITPGGTSATSSSSKFTYNLTNISVSSTAGGLSTAIITAGGNLSTVTNLTITGIIDATDFVTMRDNMTQLAVVDMSTATIAAYTGIGGTGGTSSITYPAKEVPQFAFCSSSTYVGKKSLTSVLMPTTATSIGTYAFSYCSGLTSITIPPAITSIGRSTFCGCSGLTTITIPALVTSIGISVFVNSKISVTVDLNNPNYSSIDGVLFNENQTTIIYTPNTKTGSYTIPSSVTSIGSTAFYSCTGLTSITIPASITSIGDEGFRNCTGLTSLTIPSSVTTIGNWVFMGCSGIPSITIPASVTSIGGNAFSYCTSLTSVTIPASVTTIGSVAFYNCTKLATINAYAATPVSLGTGTSVFGSVPTSCVLHVPVGSKTAYQGATQWQDFTNIMEDLYIPPTITAISPTSGSTTGGTSITITGTNFFNVSSVKFGTTNATGFTVNSATQITATSPAGTAGPVDVSVISAGGTSAFNANDQFTYVAAPNATTSPVISVTSTGATLNGTVNPNYGSTTVTFDYGLTNAYGTNVTATPSPVTGTAETAVSYALSGLTPNTTYHFRVNGVNAGGTSYGDDLTFTTQPTSTAPSAGDGTSGNPYQIATLENLCWVSQTATVWTGKYFIQTADIDASITSTWPFGGGFSPIGNITNNFAGNYNGQNHSIDGLTINRSSYLGLFGYVNGAVISNIGLTNATINGSQYLGGLAGYLDGETIITNAYATGSVITGSLNLGGLVGFINNGTITNAYATGSIIRGSSNHGGLVGCIISGTISNSHSTGSVTGTTNVGGLVGSVTSGKISNSYSTGSITGLGNNVGGLVGSVTSGKISNSYSTGSVTGAACVGGMVGTVTDGTITNTYSTASVTGEVNVGGLVGLAVNGTITNTYSIGSVSSAGTKGGLVGFADGTIITNSCWNTETSGVETSAGGAIGLTISEMNTATTFTAAGWDFKGETTNGTAEIWNIGNDRNVGYPYFDWQFPTDQGLPSITTFTPTSAGNGITVTIKGINLLGATAVSFGGTPASSFTVVDASTITAVVGSGTTGTVSVTTPCSSAISASLFTWLAAPTVTSISPTSGPAAGGTSVTINGTNLSGTTAVKFGDIAATGVTVISDIQITAISPAGTGIVDVTVTTAGGISATSSVDKFTYKVPVTPISVVSTAGGLSTAIMNAGGNLNTITNLTITGTIDARDFKTMRDNMPLLAVVDMSAVLIDPYTGGFGTGNLDTYKANEIPSFAFYISTPGAAKTSLTSVSLPTTATYIANGAFSYCSGLTSVTIPPAITSIGRGVFSGCTSLTTLTIPPSVSSVGMMAFYSCTGLTSINSYSPVPAVLDFITSSNVFGSVPTDICVLHVPVGTLTLYQGAAQWGDFVNIVDDLLIPTFANTAVNPIGLTTATGGGDITGLGITNPTQHGVAWSTTPAPTVALSTKTMLGSLDATGSFTSDITGLSEGTTYYLRGYATNSTGTYYSDEVTFRTLAVPTVTAISPATGFSSGGTSVVITGTNFTGSTSVNFGTTPATGFTVDADTQITATAPAGAGTVDVTVTNPSITSEISNVDKFTYMVAPTTIVVVSTAGGLSAAFTAAGGDLNTVSDLTITGTIDARDFVTMRDYMLLLAKLDIGAVTIVAYSGPNGTSRYANDYIGNQIPQYAFTTNGWKGKTSLKSIVMPTTINLIGEYAFYNSGLTGILNIPVNVTEIRQNAFNYCKSLTGTLKLPNTLTTLGDYAFYYCTGLTGDLILPNTLTTLGNNVFRSCSGLNGTLTLSNSLTSIGVYDFGSCTGLTGSVIIPKSVTSIGGYAFFSCSGLTGNMIIPNSVTSIGISAFESCSKLNSVTIPTSVTTIGATAFKSCNFFAAIYAYSPTPLDLSKSANVFQNVIPYWCTLHVPVGSKSLYLASTALQWRDFYNLADDLIAPTVTTQAVSSFTSTTATGNGNITSLGVPNQTTYGVCWNTTGSPTILDSKKDKGSATATGAFTADMTGLTPNTTYYVRAYATNDMGTSYGTELSFITLAPTTTWDGSTWSSSSPTSSYNVVLDGNYNNIGFVCKNLTINAGKQVIISSGIVTIGGDLTLKSDPTNGTATLINNGTLTVGGATNVEQYIIAKTGDTTTDNWWYISSPVTGATSAVFNPASVATDRNLFGYYDEPTATYPQIKTNDVLLAKGAGYVLEMNGAKGSTITYTFKGTLNDGDIPVTVTRTGASADKRGFNLVGNPYPSYLDWNALKASAGDNVRSSIWYRTRTGGGEMQFDTFDGTYGTNNGVSGMVSQYIPPMQAFWVKVDKDNSSATLTFKNSMRTPLDQSLTTNRLRAPGLVTTPVLGLKVSNGLNSDAAIVVSDPNALDGFDKYDSQKMSNDNMNIPEIYTLAGSQELVINHMNAIGADKELTLGFRPGKTGNFTIEATEISNIGANLKMMLLDKLTNIQQEIKVGSPYIFTSDATATDNRFRILFKSTSITTAIDNTSNNDDVLVYRNATNHITVVYTAKFNEASLVSVCNTIGHQLIQQKLTSTVTEIKRIFTPGVYIVTVNSGGMKITKRIIIN